MEKLVFFIAQDDFLHEFIDLSIKSQGHKSYGVRTDEDSWYLVEDLKPSLLIIDEPSVKKLDTLLSAVLASGIPFSFLLKTPREGLGDNNFIRPVSLKDLISLINENCGDAH